MVYRQFYSVFKENLRFISKIFTREQAIPFVNETSLAKTFPIHEIIVQYLVLYKESIFNQFYSILSLPQKLLLLYIKHA